MNARADVAPLPIALSRIRRPIRVCSGFAVLAGSFLTLEGVVGIGRMVLQQMWESIPFSNYAARPEYAHRFVMLICLGLPQVAWGVWVGLRGRIGAIGVGLGSIVSMALMALVRTRTGGVRGSIVGIETAFLVGLAVCAFLELQAGRQKRRQNV